MHIILKIDNLETVVDDETSCNNSVKKLELEPSKRNWAVMLCPCLSFVSQCQVHGWLCSSIADAVYVSTCPHHLVTLQYMLLLSLGCTESASKSCSQQ